MSRLADRYPTPAERAQLKRQPKKPKRSARKLPPIHEGLQVRLLGTRVNYITPHLLTVLVEELSYPDMTGTIEFATALIPDVTRIHVVSGRTLSTIYYRGEDGEWNAGIPVNPNEQENRTHAQYTARM